MVSFHDAPNPQGRVWVIPYFINGFEINVEIVGDPDGLRYLGECLVYLAGFDQESRGQPADTHAHFDFSQRQPHTDFGYLGAHSCGLTVTRHKASVTGRVFADLDKKEAFADSFWPDSTCVHEWLGYAESALCLAGDAAAGPAKRRRNTAPLAAHAIYCALMAGLRAKNIPVPEIPAHHQSGIVGFIPDGLALPVDRHLIEDLLYFSDLARPKRTGIPHPTVDQAEAAVTAARVLIDWAVAQIAAVSPPADSSST